MVLAALAVAGTVAPAGCASSSPVTSAGGGANNGAAGGASTGAAGGGAGANSPICAQVAKSYSDFLAGYTPAKGGLWGNPFTSLQVQASSAGNVNTQIATDIFAVYTDTGDLTNMNNPSGYNTVSASQLEQFDSDLKTLATDCGITLTPPVPENNN